MQKYETIVYLNVPSNTGCQYLLYFIYLQLMYYSPWCSGLFLCLMSP